MGMVGNLLRVTQVDIELYLENSKLLEEKYNQAKKSNDSAYCRVGKIWYYVQDIVTELGPENKALSRTFISYQFVDEQQDLGYGPAQYLTNIQVQETLVELQKIDEDQIKSNKEAIFPSPFDDEELKYALETFRLVVDFFEDAGKNKEAVIFIVD